MELWYFELNWKEFRVEGSQVITLTDMLKRSRGTCKVGGYTAINFEPANPEVDCIFLSISESHDGTYCMQWDDEKKQWRVLGLLRLRPEWGRHQFIRNWETCGIILGGFKRVIPLKDIFSECHGENLDGVSFIGKDGGMMDGRRALLKLNIDRRLDNYYSNQECEIFDEVRMEWVNWGTLVKKLPPTPNKPKK